MSKLPTSDTKGLQFFLQCACVGERWNLKKPKREREASKRKRDQFPAAFVCGFLGFRRISANTFYFISFFFLLPPLLCCVPTLVLLSLFFFFLMLECLCVWNLACFYVCVCEFNPQKLNISNPPPTKKPPGQISTHSPPGNYDTSSNENVLLFHLGWCCCFFFFLRRPTLEQQKESHKRRAQALAS